MTDIVVTPLVSAAQEAGGMGVAAVYASWQKTGTLGKVKPTEARQETQQATVFDCRVQRRDVVPSRAVHRELESHDRPEQGRS